jgi:hypothetical protein
MSKKQNTEDRILELEDENYALKRQIANLMEHDKTIEDRLISILEDLGFKRK